MSRYHFTSSGSYSNYSNEILKNIVENSVGKLSDQEERTIINDAVHPASHGQSNVNAREQAFDTANGSNLDQGTSDIQKQVYRDARKALELTPEMKAVKNKFVNQLL